MSANAHTAVMTDLEQRIQDGRQLSAPRPRINRIMEDRFYGRKPRVDIQRAVLFTQSMMQTEAYPQVLRTALAIQYMMEHIEVVIQPHELIVGTAGGPGRYCVLYPETRGGQFPRDLPKILKAEGKAGYAMTQAEVDTVLNEVVPYWKGKTSHELYLNMLPRETRRVIYGDEEYATQGLIFDEANNAHTLSWTGSYEKVIREGLESIIRELEEKKAGIEGNLLHNQMDKIYYLDAAILSCKAMITYAHRYADRAEAMAAEESDPVRRAELETIAEICRHVPEHPARNFYEAVQAQWFLQVGYRLENMNGGGVGLGRLDQYLYPLYKAGLEDGTLTEGRAMEILECMFIKVGEVVPYQGKSTAGGHEGRPCGGNNAIRCPAGLIPNWRKPRFICYAKASQNWPCARLQRHGHGMTARGPGRPTCAKTSCTQALASFCGVFCVHEALCRRSEAHWEKTEDRIT